MAPRFVRQVWFFPLVYLDARGCQVPLNQDEPSADRVPHAHGEATETWVGRREPWIAALVGAIPFLLYGLAHLLDGFAELGGHNHPAINLLNGSLTLPVGVYFAVALGLSLGVLKGFPRWSYAYLGMCLYFGWSYNNQNYYGLFYKWWVWLPLVAAILLGLLLARSLKPLVRLLQGAWNDWTRLSFVLYAFAAPMATLISFEEDWGVTQLYGLCLDSLLLAAVAVVFLRSPTIPGRILSLEAAVLILVVRWNLVGGTPTFDEPQRMLSFWALFLPIYFGYLLLPAGIGLLRWGVNALTSR